MACKDYEDVAEVMVEVVVEAGVTAAEAPPETEVPAAPAAPAAPVAVEVEPPVDEEEVVVVVEDSLTTVTVSFPLFPFEPAAAPWPA